MVVYYLEIKEHVDEKIHKIKKRDSKAAEIIYKKLEKIVDDPYKFKPLRNDMKGDRRVHVNRHFVLVYAIDEIKKIVIVKDYDHHDKIFGK